MARKFRILQVGGKDLEPLFDSKKVLNGII